MMSSDEIDYFYHLCGNGTLKEVKAAIKKGVITYYVTRQADLIRAAAQNINPEILDLILDNGININAKNDQKMTPFGFDGETALMEVFEFEAVLRLIEKGANVNEKSSDARGWTVLMHSVRSAVALLRHHDILKEAIAIITLLIENGADVNATNFEGLTALMLSVGLDSDRDILF